MDAPRAVFTIKVFRVVGAIFLTVHFITAVVAVNFPITPTEVLDAPRAVFTPEAVRAADAHFLTVLFITAVAAVILPITPKVGRDATFAAFTPEPVRAVDAPFPTVSFVTLVRTGRAPITSVVHGDAAAVGATATTLELVVAAGAVCFVTPVSTVISPVTSPCLPPEAAAAVTPELVLAAGLCAVGLVAAVVTVVPSVTPLGLINAPLVPVGGEALELLLSAGTQEVVAFRTVAVFRGVAAPALVAAAGDVAVGVTPWLFVEVPPLPALAVRAPPLGTVGLVAAVVTVVPSVTPLGLINAPLVPVGGEALELLLSAGTQEVVAFRTVAVFRGVAAPALVAAAGDVAVGVTLCPSVVLARPVPPSPAPAVRAPPLGTRCRRRRCSTRRPCAARRSHGQSSEED